MTKPDDEQDDVLSGVPEAIAKALNKQHGEPTESALGKLANQMRESFDNPPPVPDIAPDDGQDVSTVASNDDTAEGEA